MSLSDKMMKELCKSKEAFILEELQPSFKDGKICQKVKLRLAEIKDFKILANQRFKEFIRLLKEDIDKTNLNYEDVWDWKGNTPEDIVKILIDKLAGDELI